ncbi:MAG: hypothetical protein M1839_004761 [Geoglossum umbratile]|nr:MAG: hypothetical protein M1839_004761 [Geoglossum umbratile]
MASALYNTTYVLRKRLGRYIEAVKLLRECLELEESAVSKEHPFTLWNIQDLAETLRWQELWDEAKSWEYERLRRTINAYGDSSQEAGLAMLELGWLNKDLIVSRSMSAEHVHALETWIVNEKKIWGVNTLIVVPAIMHLSISHADTGRYRLAFENILEALRVLATQLGERSRTWRGCKDRLEGYVREVHLRTVGKYCPEILSYTYSPVPPEITIAEVCELFGPRLKEVGVDMNTCFGNAGQNPTKGPMIQTAVSYGDIKTVKTLLEYGVEFEGLFDVNGESATSTATKKGYVEILQLLEEARSRK